MKFSKIIIIALALIAVGILGRLLEHLPNATPIAAISLLAFYCLPGRLAFVVPLLTLLLTDFLLGFYAAPVMLSVYGSFALIALLAYWASRQRDFHSGLVYILAAPLSFFLITNAAVWWFSPWYVKNLSGLLLSYERGLPFLRNMILGDLIYTGLLCLVAATLQLVLAKSQTFSWQLVKTRALAAFNAYNI